jgi:pimeloyl-ACP methyl ester carboxylesterase
VLFDSGLGGDSFDWAHIAPEVAKFTQACTYDRAGMGYSDPGPNPRTSGQIAKELAELIQNSGIARPVILVGLSFGGFNTRIVASEHPDLVAGLVLVSASHENQGERYAAAGVPSGRPPYAIVKLGPIAASLGILRLMGVTLGAPPERADPQVREFVLATAYRTSRYYAMGDELEHTRESGLEVAATRRQLAIPLVVVSPGKGSGVRAEINQDLQADLATLSTRACQVIAEDSGHGIGNQPDLVVRVIRDVLLAAEDEIRKPGC